MRTLIFAALLCAGSAHAAQYAVVCTAPCVASDGTTQPAGTVIAGPVLWDGAARWTLPAGQQAVAWTGQTVYAPAPAAPTQLSSLDFLKRFTSDERAAIRATPALADWVSLATASTTIDVTDPLLLQGMAGAVAAGAITTARSAQILDLTHSSP